MGGRVTLGGRLVTAGVGQARGTADVSPSCSEKAGFVFSKNLQLPKKKKKTSLVFALLRFGAKKWTRKHNLHLNKHHVDRLKL